jgi:hypothetical protein
VLITGAPARLIPVPFVDELCVYAHAGADKLILMTPTFDVVSETPLHTTEFGAGALRAPRLPVLPLTRTQTRP